MRGPALTDRVITRTPTLRTLKIRAERYRGILPDILAEGLLGSTSARTSMTYLLHTVIRQHLETFLAEASCRAAGARLPEFVEPEFREFLTCGVLAHGFARVRCDTCAFERLVAFSCKGHSRNGKQTTMV